MAEIQNDNKLEWQSLGMAIIGKMTIESNDSQNGNLEDYNIILMESM